jgi:hypothetical protein
MSAFEFPPLPLETWQPTYDTLHHYTRVLSSVRRALTLPQKHWYHASLRVNALGLTTTPIPYGSELFEIVLDLMTHRVIVMHSRGLRTEWRLRGQPLSQFWSELHDALAAWDIQPNALKPDYTDAAPVYNARDAENFWRALSQVHLVLQQFQSGLRQESSPVQFWSHHFDLALLWFSGRTVPGQDPHDAENADEQMNFGFSVGDEKIREPYFYATAYPLPEHFVGAPLPAGAYWHTDGWNGAVLLYESLAAADAPDARLLDFWRTVQKRGAEWMQNF